MSQVNFTRSTQKNLDIGFIGFNPLRNANDPQKTRHIIEYTRFEFLTNISVRSFPNLTNIVYGF